MDEATTVVGKIVAYEGQSTNGPWTSQALLVADKDDTENFTQDSPDRASRSCPRPSQVDRCIYRTRSGSAAAQQDIINGINSGQLLVNYLGHGSEEQWSGSDIFDANSVAVPDQ